MIEQLQGAGRVVKNQVETLISGKSPSKADREERRVEGVRAGLHKVDVFTVGEAVHDDLAPDETDKVASLLATGRPQLLVRDRLDPLPEIRVGGVGFPALAKMPGEHRPHGRGHPRRQMHAVGDVLDRHLLDRLVREHHVPHLASHEARGARSPHSSTGRLGSQAA